MKRLCFSFVGSTKIELSEVVVDPGNAIVTTKIIIAAAPPMLHPTKIFFDNEIFLFGFAGSVTVFQLASLHYKVKINHKNPQCSSSF